MKYFSLVETEEIHPNRNDKVIPGEEFSTLLKAEEVLKKAEDEAIKKVELAKKQATNIRKKAKLSGHQEGLDTFNEHILKFEENLKHLRHETQRQILPLALKAAKKIVNRELELDPTTIVDIVTGTLRPVTQYKQIKIYVNKADREILESERDSITKVLDHVESFSIAEREDVEPGGCIIETEAGMINASLENQWRALEAAFEKFMKSS